MDVCSAFPSDAEPVRVVQPGEGSPGTIHGEVPTSRTPLNPLAEHGC